MTVRFLEETRGVLSMARLAAFLQTVGGFVVLMAVVIVAFRDGEHAAGIIAAMAAASAAAFAGAWAALKERHNPAVIPPSPNATTVNTTGAVIVEPSQ